MHIPTIEKTTDIEILSFERALDSAFVPNDSYDINKWLYVPSFYSEYRYILGTKGKNPLICIGINPSTAEPDNLDNTLKSVERVAFHNGFDSFIMFNVYAQRATNPDDMEQLLNKQLHGENLKAFEYILNLYSSDNKPAVWAAWGTIIEKRQYLFDCVTDFIEIGKRYDANWYTAGKRSKSGHPHHPLYLPKTSILEDFEPMAYINSFSH